MALERERWRSANRRRSDLGIRVPRKKLPVLKILIWSRKFIYNPAEIYKTPYVYQIIFPFVFVCRTTFCSLFYFVSSGFSWSTSCRLIQRRGSPADASLKNLFSIILPTWKYIEANVIVNYFCTFYYTFHNLYLASI